MREERDAMEKKLTPTPSATRSSVSETLPINATPSGSSWRRTIKIAVSLLLVYAVWKADVVWHYVQFKQLCVAEGGLQSFEPLRKGVGWERISASAQVVNGKRIPHTSLQQALILTKAIPNIGFVRTLRYPNDPLPELGDDGLMDVKYVTGTTYDAKVGFKPADLSIPILYQYVSDSSWNADQRITRFVQEVRDAATQKVFLRNTQLEFHWRSIPVWHWFGPAGITGCPLVYPERSRVEQIQSTAFAN